jgi:DNA-binding MarR family transcriptional regulator
MGRGNLLGGALGGAAGNARLERRAPPAGHDFCSGAAADRVGINATDLNCLNILSFSGSLTAGELAKATGLTTASITGVVDRLETAGFVHRERDQADRRRVVVTIVIEKALREVASIFAPMVADWQQLADRYSDDELRLIVEFYDLMEQIIRKHLARLREPSAPADDAGP